MAATQVERQVALDALHARIGVCRRCAEAGYFVGAPVVTGRLGARVMLIGQAPSEAAAIEGQSFAWPDSASAPDWTMSWDRR